MLPIVFLLSLPSLTLRICLIWVENWLMARELPVLQIICLDVRLLEGKSIDLRASRGNPKGLIRIRGSRSGRLFPHKSVKLYKGAACCRIHPA